MRKGLKEKMEGEGRSGSEEKKRHAMELTVQCHGGDWEERVWLTAW